MLCPENIINVVLAAALGGVIGLEREAHGKFAGLRTNILICLGAAVFTIISRQIANGTEASPARIAAQIVTGVGFLGAGAIIRDRGGIYGLTTAATIWMVASIGMACGAGLFKLAVTTTIIALLVLLGLTPLETRVSFLRKKYKLKPEPGDENNEKSSEYDDNNNQPLI
jgi:putative Mg2+ transporter-C (MgtC) family protein